MKGGVGLEKFEAHLVRARRSRATRELYLGYARRYLRWCRGREGSVEELVAGFLSTLARRVVVG